MDKYKNHRIFDANIDYKFNIEKGYLNGDYLLHSHEFTELTIIYSGEGIHIINNNEYVIKAGDVYVLLGDTLHGFKNTKNLIFIVIKFDNSFILSEDELKKVSGYNSLFILEPFYRKNYNYNHLRSLNKKDLENVIPMINIMINEFTEKNQGYKIVIESSLKLLFCILSRMNSHKNNATDIKLFDISEIISYIENNFNKEISIIELCNIAYISSRHFSRVFKQLFNIAPFEYITEKRINKAKELLEDTNDTITEISHICGYMDVNYFSRIFKRKSGLTPSAYRKIR